MALERDRILSEFVDAWNAGRRPDVDDYLARAPAEERDALADALVAFLAFAPTPAYTEASLEAIRGEPAVAAAIAAAGEQGGLLPALLTRARERFSITTTRLAEEMAPLLGLSADQVERTASYLDRLEHGHLEPAGVSRRVFEALARVLGVPRDELEGAADVGGWGLRLGAVAPVFRADEDAADAVAAHLEVLADAFEAPGGERRDEVDDLFLVGR